MAFVTDGSIENRGFQLNYTTMEVSRVAARLPHLPRCAAAAEESSGTWPGSSARPGGPSSILMGWTVG